MHYSKPGFGYTGLLIGLGQGMTYHRENGLVEYQSKDGKETKVFDALEWLAATRPPRFVSTQRDIIRQVKEPPWVLAFAGDGNSGRCVLMSLTRESRWLVITDTIVPRQRDSTRKTKKG